MLSVIASSLSLSSIYYVILCEEQVLLLDFNELLVHKSNWIQPNSICLGVITVVEVSFKKNHTS